MGHFLGSQEIAPSDAPPQDGADATGGKESRRSSLDSGQEEAELVCLDSAPSQSFVPPSDSTIQGTPEGRPMADHEGVASSQASRMGVASPLRL